MNWRRLASYGIALLWVTAVIAWPEPSDTPDKSDDLTTHYRQASGEGLYKSTLTKANFGLSGVHFYESSGGKKHWNIRSKFAELHRKENYAFMQEVDALFYAEKTGNVVATKSDYGRSLTDKNFVELEGNVSIRSKSGYLFWMERLNYNGKAHEFLTEDVVQMKGPNVAKPSMFLKGTGMHADIDKEHFFLKRQVSAQKRLKTSDWLRITSKAGEFFTDDQRALFTGNVHAALPDMTIRSDEFELSVTQEQEFIRAHGHVVLENKNRVGHAENAYLEIGGNRIILEGSAQIDSKDNQIRGRRIVLHSDDDRVEVEEAEGKVRH